MNIKRFENWVVIIFIVGFFIPKIFEILASLFAIGFAVVYTCYNCIKYWKIK